MENKSFIRRAWGFIKRVFIILFIAQLIYIIALKWINPPITITQLASVIRGEGLRRDYIDDDEISYNMKLAVIAAEDQLFSDHGGFDWKHIQKAIENNDKQPNRVKGASTISQQTAKNVFLWQGRSWIRKGLEVYFTKMIEWIWGKERILEVYLNVIEMGEGVYGAEAAANKYFNKPASKLTRKEAAMIAASLPNPKRYTVKPVSKYVVNKTGWVMRQMNYLDGDAEVRKIITEEEKIKTSSKK